MHYPALVALSLFACSPDPDPDPVTEPAPDVPLIGVTPPLLPSQILTQESTYMPEELEVTHTGPSGDSAMLEAVYTLAGEHIGWRAPGGQWAVGAHTVTVDPAKAQWQSPGGGVASLRFDIADTWDGDGREHAAWTIDGLVVPPTGLGPLVLAEVGDLVVVPPSEADGDWVLLTTGWGCAIYRGPVVVLPQGYALTLATLEVEIGAEGPLVLEDTTLAFSFARDGARGAGHFRALADARQTTDLDDDDGFGPASVCSLMQAFGATCYPCQPGDEQPLCFDAVAPWVSMSPRVDPLPFDPLAIPVCGVDVSGAEAPQLEINIPPITCNVELVFDPAIDCGCQSAPGRLGLTLIPAAVLWWRRRRSAR